MGKIAENPLRLGLQRPKTGVEFYTFLGKDAVGAVEAYLTDAKRRGIKFTSSTPLFVKQRRANGMVEGLAPKNVGDMMREVAIKSGFVDDKMNGKDFNSLGLHALRESFGSIMINSGVPDTVVDFWHGHEIGEMAKAYKSVQYESLRKMYLEREPLISVSTGSLNAEEIDRKVAEKVDEHIESLQKVIANYAAEDLELKSRLSRVELEVTEVKKALEKLIS